MMSDPEKALKILWSCGLHPGYYDTIEKAAEAVHRMIQDFREDLANPPHDVQCAVLKKLGVHGFTGDEPARVMLVPFEERGD